MSLKKYHADPEDLMKNIVEILKTIAYFVLRGVVIIMIVKKIIKIWPT